MTDELSAEFGKYRDDQAWWMIRTQEEQVDAYRLSAVAEAAYLAGAAFGAKRERERCVEIVRRWYQGADQPFFPDLINAINRTENVQTDTGGGE